MTRKITQKIKSNGAKYRNLAPIGKFERGAKKRSATLTDKKVLEIRHKYNADQNTSCAKLGMEYKVSNVTIWKIIRGISWRHVGGIVL